MGDRNDSLTRVQPIFDALLDQRSGGDVWLSELWGMAASTRPGVALSKPADFGELLDVETTTNRTDRLGTVYERVVPPPTAFLRWLLENPQRMQVRDPVNFGGKSDRTQRWRRKLFSGDTHLVTEAQEEARRQLGKRLAQRGRNKWWAFEGFARVDCCVVTNRCVLFVEGSHPEGPPPSTLWFPDRTQLWRNVEAAKELASGRAFAVILAVEREPDGKTALTSAASSRDDSYPHLDAKQRTELDRHLLGFVTWSQIVARCGLPPECLSDDLVPME